jgi:ABC-2 type transport system permease protein
MMPLVQLFLLGYAATNDVRNVPLGVFNQDRGPEARALLDAYRAADYFSLKYEVHSEDALRDLIDSGRAQAGLVIPPDYGLQVQGNGLAEVAFILDGSDPNVASTAYAAAQAIGQQQATRVLSERLGRLGQPSAIRSPIEVRTQVWYNPDLESAYFMIPGVIGMILYAITSILTATAVVRERERGTIEQLIVTPIRSWELIAGKLLPYVILAFINTLEVLVIGVFWFKVPIRGDLGLILLLSGLFLVSSLGIGLLASTIAKTQQEAMLTVFMTLLPSVFISGFFFPIEAMPQVVQWFSYLTPLRYFLVIIRSLMLKGVGAEMLKGDILALAILGGTIMTAAVLRFRKRLD